jgi:hypothetical protein
MSLWGTFDAKPQTNTAIATVTVTAANSTVVGVNTKLSTDFAVGDYLHVGRNNYVFLTISNNTVGTVRSANPGGTLVGAQSNGNYIVSEKPLYITYAMTSVNANDVYGVSAAEMNYANNNATESDGITHSGWNLRTAGTGGRAGRVFYETLVAGSIQGDAADDTKLPE